MIEVTNDNLFEVVKNFNDTGIATTFSHRINDVKNNETFRVMLFGIRGSPYRNSLKDEDYLWFMKHAKEEEKLTIIESKDGKKTKLIIWFLPSFLSFKPLVELALNNKR